MRPAAPPLFLDRLLLFLLPPRDRETVSGDLYEEFVEAKLPELGRFNAHLWYMRQMLSFVPGKAAAILLQGPALRLVCCFTALAGCWLCLMDLLLRHPGLASQLLIEATIVAQALLTLAALRFHRYGGLRVIAIVGCLPLLWLSISALKAMFGAAQFEGYVLLISLALIAQVVLTVSTLPRLRIWPRLRTFAGKTHDTL